MDERTKSKGPLQANQEQSANTYHQSSAPAFESALSLLSSCPTAPLAQNVRAEPRTSSGTINTKKIQNFVSALIYLCNLAVCVSFDAAMQQRSQACILANTRSGVLQFHLHQTPVETVYRRQLLDIAATRASSTTLLRAPASLHISRSNSYLAGEARQQPVPAVLQPGRPYKA